jgi:hypothetical protein
MKIEVNRNNKGLFFKIISKINANKRAFLITAAVIGISLLFICSRYASLKVKEKGYSGLWDFMDTLVSNYFQGRKANPESISIEIKKKDLNILEKNRQNALERGLIINDIDGDYVSAVLDYKGKKINVKLRLKGHMTDHLQDNKWSFRIKVKGKDSFMGMKRFSIQHPGTRGYIYEWIYHELMKRESIISLRYKFINVSVNGKDWGIYAVEENFDNELIENNERLKGPLVRFNPDMYWVERYSELKRETREEEFASFYSANPEAYNEDNVLKDSIQKEYYLKAIALMEGFRDRKLSAKEVFDISRMAKFHAIIDLVGGEHSVDWSDIKYYYNPVTSKLEPVAYESFTDFPTRRLTGMYKFVELDSSRYFEDWHTAIYSDPVFFSAYVKELERISEPEYLNTFFEKSNDALKENLTIIYKEFPYKKFDKNSYYINQQMIRKMLNAPRSINAYVKDTRNGKICLSVGPIDALPIEIGSLSIGNILIKPEQKIILPAKQNNEIVKYHDYNFTLPANFTMNDSLIKHVMVNYSVLGSSIKEKQKVFPYPHTDNDFLAEDLKARSPNFKDFEFITVDESLKKIVFKTGKHIINKSVVIPEGYRLVAAAGTYLDFTNYSGLISYSPLFFQGNDDDNIFIGSSDSTGQGITVIKAEKPSEISSVTFKNIPSIKDKIWNRNGAITFYECAANFKNCSFYNCRAASAVNLIRAEFSFDQCLFKNIKNDALQLDYSTGNIKSCVFEDCGEDAIEALFSIISTDKVYIKHIAGKGYNIKTGSFITALNTKVINANIGVSLVNHSNAKFNTLLISESNFGIYAHKNKSGDGAPTITITGLNFNNVKNYYVCEKDAKINANGVEIKESEKVALNKIRSSKKADE